jgi:hypothetical protein
MVIFSEVNERTESIFKNTLKLLYRTSFRILLTLNRGRNGIGYLKGMPFHAIIYLNYPRYKKFYGTITTALPPYILVHIVALVALHVMYHNV